MPTQILSLVRAALVCSMIAFGAGCSSTTNPADGSTDVASTTDVTTDVPMACHVSNAVGTGACATVLGWAWEGTTCQAISGCSCSGSDCASLYATQAACSAATSTCPDCRTLGCSGGGSCQACLGPNGVVYVCLSGGVC